MITTTPPDDALRPFLTAHHELLWKEADGFAAGQVAPWAARVEKSPARVDHRLAHRMAERGWFAVTVPREYGGLAAGHVSKVILIHRIARVSAAAAAILQATLIPVGALLGFATGEQKQYWLPQVAEGSLLLSIASTEPDAGGHIGGIKTTATRRGRDWVITGSKSHIGNAGLAGAHLVIARTSGTRSTSRALTAFLVESGSTGLSVTDRPALGLRGFSAGRLDLDHVRVPDTHRIGEQGQGMAVAQSSSILYGRPNIAAVSLGLHEAVVQATTTYLKSRPRYTSVLSDQPVVRDRIGDLDARLRAARVVAYHAVHLLDRGLACDAELINSKYLGHAWAAQSAQAAMELHGAQALDAAYPLQRLWRDIQHTYPPAGTGEVQRLRLADAALGEIPVQWSTHSTAHAARPSADYLPIPA
ncbi:acyl-CoA dehydrogenase family protein [Streptomyces murinus]|uniref:acyl-CoA dehydrogenase family protein n=1 Tax=Streptomyces murinus TaxID=33900 RepID=UPI0036E2F4C0